MPKERSINPAAAQRKADKQKEISKSKRNVQAQRNEKLARRNPERLQRQVDELKELETRGTLRPKDKETLAQLERDLKGVKRARDALGDAAPKFASHERTDIRQEQRDRRQHLGKRRRDDGTAHDSGGDTDPEVRSIPMPRDTPPPIPRRHFADTQVGPDGKRVPHALPAKPAAPAAPQTVYSSAPQMRDLKKEAVRFMPSVVSQQKNRVRGQGRLLESEEADRLEKAGYTAAQKAAGEAGQEAKFAQRDAQVRAEGRQDVGAQEDEFARFEREIGSIYPDQAAEVAKPAGGGDGSRQVEMEEVEDDGV